MDEKYQQIVCPFCGRKVWTDAVMEQDKICDFCREARGLKE